jgi:hypothetical protein
LRLALRQGQAAAKTEQAIQTIAFATRDNNLPVGEACFSWDKRRLKNFAQRSPEANCRIILFFSRVIQSRRQYAAQDKTKTELLQLVPVGVLWIATLLSAMK